MVRKITHQKQKGNGEGGGRKVGGRARERREVGNERENGTCKLADSKCNALLLSPLTHAAMESVTNTSARFSAILSW